MTTFAKKLRKARLERGWSQERLARALGVSKFTVQRWEAGKTRPTSMAIIMRIRKVLGENIIPEKISQSR